MLHARTNIAKFYSKVGEFLIVDKYTDVSIKCEDQIFNCHRLTLASASDFFDTLFSSDFKETKERVVVLKETTAKVFKEVLEFVYKGHVAITEDNLCGLLEASEFFNLVGLRDLCVEFVQNNKIIGEGVLELFAFAYTTKKTLLVKMLSQDILPQLNVLKQSKAFSELSFDAMNTILCQLSNWTSSEVKKDEVLLSAIIQWIEHAREERGQYFKRIFKMVRFENMTAEYMRFVIENMYNPAVIAKCGSSSSNMVDHGENPVVTQRSSSVIARNYLQMHVYVRCTHQEFFTMMNIFSFDNIRQCSLSHTMNLAGIPDKMSPRIRSVPIAYNAYLYSLYFRNRRYSRDAENTSANQSFRLYTSTDMRSELTLTPPPLIFGDVSLCPIQNNIYAYNHTLFQKVIKTSLLTNFNEEEITRGIYLYNCELDVWFPVPMMKEKLQDSCMVTCDNVLYLIGGATDSNPPSTKTTVQSYDHRTGFWRLLPSTFYYHRGGDCCVLNNQIYVCGGGGTGVGRYDITAGKWETLTSMQKNSLYHRVIPYSNDLWLMGGLTNSEDVRGDTLDIQIYEPSQDKWSSSTKLKETVEDTFGADKEYYFLDGVVFSHLCSYNI